MEENGSSLVPRVLMLAAAVAAGGGFYYYSSIRQAPVSAPAAAVPEQPGRQEARPSRPPLPVTLGDSDAFVRKKAGELSSSARWAGWLGADTLVRRFTAAVGLIAAEKSPRDSLAFLAPEKGFSVVKKGGKLCVDPKSYARYDPLGNVVQSLDASAAAGLLDELQPLFQEACREMDCEKEGLRAVLVRAIKELLRTPVVDGDIRLKPKVVTYTMEDPALEGLGPAQKHLLRMGPKNVLKIQLKLRELGKTLGVPDVELPQAPQQQVLKPVLR